jgi:superfamily II DNA or RNA helicase
LRSPTDSPEPSPSQPRSSYAVASPQRGANLSDLDDARRAMMDIVRSLELATHFSRSSLKSADVMARDAQGWRGPLAWFRPDGSQAFVLQREMFEGDSRNRLVSIYLYRVFGAVTVESTCSCGEDRCTHAAALLLRVQKFFDWPRHMTPFERWERTLQCEPTREAEPQDCRTARQIVCLLGTDGAHVPARLCARLVLIPESGDLRPATSLVGAHETEAQPYLTRQASLWQAQLALGAKSLRSAYVLQGDQGTVLLAELLDAGVCYHEETRLPIHRSSVRVPRWLWLRDEDASTRISLDLEDGVDVVDLDGLHYLDATSGAFGRFDLRRETLEELQHMPALPPQPQSIAWPPHPLLSAIPAPPAAPALRSLDTSLRPTLVVGASRRAEGRDFVFYGHARADYGGYRLSLAVNPWQGRVVGRLKGEYVSVSRDIEGELRAEQVLRESGLASLATILPSAWRTLIPAPDRGAFTHPEHHAGEAEAFVAFDSSLQVLRSSGFAIEYDPDIPFALLPETTPLRATLAPTPDSRWMQFELAALIDGEEVDILPSLLNALQSKVIPLVAPDDEPADAQWLAPIGPQRFLPLRLSNVRDWLAPLVECVSSRRSVKDVRLSRSQALALADCLQRQRVPIGGTAARNVTETLALLRSACESALPIKLTSFRGTLRHYQLEGLQWLQALRHTQLGGVLADDMGLGKTVQIIAHLLLEFEAGRLTRPALLVVPTSLVFNWTDEMARFAPTLPLLNYTGSQRAFSRWKLRDACVILTSYALLVNEVDELEAIDYSAVILDEAQWIKNPMTQTAGAVRRLRAAHRLAVTGTPLENHLGELWAHFDAVMPGYLGDPLSFRRAFRIPIERQDDDERMAVLRQRTAPFLLRRKKATVAPELPSKTETVLRVSMHEEQRRLYETLRLSLCERVRQVLASASTGASRIVVLTALLRLRQVCCDPRLIPVADVRPPSAKLDAALELIASLHDEGRQILLFSQFTSMLELIARSLDARQLPYAMLTGKTADRATPVRCFQSGATPILLASLKAGGVGLNLTAADAVIHYDPWWNPAVELQAVDRAHRLGREQPIFVYKLLCEATIEEKIEAMKDNKHDLACALLGEDRSPARGLNDGMLRTVLELASSARDEQL